MDTLSNIHNLCKDMESIKEIVEVSNSTIANEISAVNTLLVAFTITIGVVGVILGGYITWLQKKVSKMNNNIEEKERLIIELAKQVESTDNKIQSDIRGLYKQLRNEETMALLDRLEEEPQDIGNLIELLYARPIDKDGYSVLKSAYVKLLKNKEENELPESRFSQYKHSYLMLFFQHFMHEALLDNDIREDLRGQFVSGCAHAYKRDIIKSTKDLCYALSESNIPFEKEPLLADYLKAINKSNYSELIELKNIFQDEIRNSALLANAIERCTNDKVYLSLFGITPPADSNKTE